MSQSPPDALWRDRDFARLWMAQSVSAFGARITREGLPLAAVLSLGASPGQVGLLAAISHGPALLVGLAAGGFVDRSRRRGIMMAADLVRAAVLATIPIAALLGVLTLPQLYIAAALVGAASVLFEIADHAYLPSLVAREQIGRANASFSATESVAEIGGPALAGVLFQGLAAPLAIAANAVTYLVSAGFLFGIRRTEAAPHPEAHARWADDVRLGFGVALRDPLVRPVFLSSWMQSLGGGFFSALYILFCVEVVGLTPALLGLTIAAGGVGALAGAAVAGPASRRLGVGPTFVGAQVLVALSVAIIPLSPPNPGAGMVFLVTSQILGDLLGVTTMILGTTLIQTVMPVQVLGRVNAAYKAATGGLVVLGALLGGMLGEVIGVRGAIWVGVAGLAAAPLLSLPGPLRRLRDMPDGPADQPAT
ncbi:MFS transporter [Phenylobacterium sp.]|uniref:MFS transporter n=1 Tax=Phenylobacterium sp. TaxID=1871053 RepID=UPI001220CD41|nr:MFS transporter [Phenylobacterium sp.]TAL32305.1 MAG: MFS transporter [Phenylobacterium sp.]